MGPIAKALASPVFVGRVLNRWQREASELRGMIHNSPDRRKLQARLNQLESDIQDIQEKRSNPPFAKIVKTVKTF